MASVNLVQTQGAVARVLNESRPGVTLTDDVVAVAGMCGAVLGAVAGAILATTSNAVALGTLGVLIGSVVSAAVGRYALLPLWSALFPSTVPRV